MKITFPRVGLLYFLPLFMLAISLPTKAQEQQQSLTLEESVLGQYRQFYPAYTFGVQWIPETDNLAYLKQFVLLMQRDNSGNEKELASIMKINNQLGTSLRYFQNLSWKNETTFFLMDDIGVYSYNWQKEIGEKRLFTPNSANHELHSPTGRVAFTLKNNIVLLDENNKTHQVTKHKDSNIVAGQAIARSEMGINKGLFWSPKGNYIAFYQKDETAIKTYPLVDINVTPGSLKLIKYPMAGQSSEQPKVGIYDVKKKKVVYISPRGEKDDYLTNISWTPDEKHILIAEVNREQKKYELNLYEVKSGKYLRTLYEEKSDTWVEPKHGAHFFENSNEFIWVSEKDGFDNIYLCSVSNGLVKQLTNHLFVVKEIVHLTKEEVFYTATGENPLNTLLYSVSKSGDAAVITREEGVHNVEIHPSGKLIWDAYSNKETPRKEIIIDKKGNILNVLSDAENPLSNYKIGNTIVDKIQSNDNHDLWYRMILPTDFDSTKQYPVLIYVYGGPHAQLVTNAWMQGASLWMHWLADQGYIVFTLDNRGSAYRGVKFEHGVHRQLGSLELEDQVAGVNYLKSLTFVDDKRLAVHGWSFGGFMTGTLMLKKPDLFNVGVAGGPVTDWKFYEVMYGERYMDTPEQNPEGYKNASLLNHVKGLKGELLLIHGTVDDVVVMQHNLALVQAFINEGIQVDFFPYPMHPHNVSGKDRVHLMTKVLSYIMEKNK